MIEILKSLLTKVLKKSEIKEEYLWIVAVFLISIIYLLFLPHFLSGFNILSGNLLFLTDVIVSDRLRSEANDQKNYLRVFFIFVLFSFLIDSYLLRIISVLYLINNVSSPYVLRSKTQILGSLTIFITNIFYIFGFADVISNEFVGFFFAVALICVVLKGCLSRKSHFQSLLMTIIYYECLLSNEIAINPNLMLLPIFLLMLKMLQRFEFESMNGNQRLFINRSQLVWLSIATSIYCGHLSIATITMSLCLVAKVLKDDFFKMVTGLVLGLYILLESLNQGPTFGFSLVALLSIQIILNYLLLNQKIEKMRSLQIKWKENQVTLGLLAVFIASLSYLTRPTTWNGLGLSALLILLSILFGALVIFIVKSTTGNGKKYIPFVRDFELTTQRAHVPNVTVLFVSLESLFSLTTNFIHHLFLDLESRVNGLHLFILGSLVVFAIWATRLGM